MLKKYTAKAKIKTRRVSLIKRKKKYGKWGKPHSARKGLVWAKTVKSARRKAKELFSGYGMKLVGKRRTYSGRYHFVQRKVLSVKVKLMGKKR